MEQAVTVVTSLYRKVQSKQKQICDENEVPSASIHYERSIELNSLEMSTKKITMYVHFVKSVTIQMAL